MALAVKTPIRLEDLRGVKDFYDGPAVHGSKAGKIFLLEGANDSKLVIKDDAVFDQQVAHSRSIMKAVHRPSSRVSMLQPAETEALKTFCRYYFEIRQSYKEFGMKYRSDMKLSVKKLQDALARQDCNFQKMTLQEVKDVKGALEKRLSGDKTELEGFTATLKGPGGLESLGEIVAADLVTGNTDRFMPRGWGVGEEGVKAWTIGGQQFNFKVLVNPGNVFVSLGPGGRASGLDYLDPQSAFKNFAMRLEEHESAYNARWPARILTDRSARKKYAERIIHDLEILLNPHKSRFSTRTKLGKARKDRLVSGMVSGAGKIATRIQQKAGIPMPPAIKDRYDILVSVR